MEEITNEKKPHMDSLLQSTNFKPVEAGREHQIAWESQYQDLLSTKTLPLRNSTVAATVAEKK